MVTEAVEGFMAMALTKAAKEEAYGGVEFIVVDGCGNGGGERSGYGRAKQGYDSCGK